MGKGGKKLENGQTSLYGWDEIKTHNKKDDSWLVIHGKVYNVTNFLRKHPGGGRIMASYGGQDATDVWTAMHNDKPFVEKYMKPLCVGDVDNQSETEIDKDFRELRDYAEKNNLMRVNPFFYVIHLLGILAFDIGGYMILAHLGTSWLPYIAAAICFCTAQAQAGWLQHDFGHLSVFNSRQLNHVVHHIIIGLFKGASSHWWNFRHFLHHAKPNIVQKDPDIEVDIFFVLGDIVPKIFGEKKRKGVLPYNLQQYYFFALTPLLLPVHFFWNNFWFVYKRKDYVDFVLLLIFYYRVYYMLSPLLGGWGALWMYLIVRTMESHWFTWCTQMSHIPMEVDYDTSKDWFHLQLESTCNVDPGLFNDWFSGHLDFQIEHHLFPTMPRHNLIKVSPLVKSMCKKHGVPYRCKPLMTAFADVVRSLKVSGKLWYKSYHEV